MPKVQVKKSVEVTLVMDEAEAKWLRDYLQNWRLDEEESVEGALKRERLFEALKEALK